MVIPHVERSSISSTSHIRTHRMTSYSFARSSSFASHPHHFGSWIQTHTSWLNIMSLCLLFVLCLSYIIQVNHSVSKGYQIRELEDQVQGLTLVNQKLEVETQQAQALTTIARATKMLGLVKADQPTYLSSTTPSYALAQ